MHIIHLVLLEIPAGSAMTDDVASAALDQMDLLDPWFDWYEVGGRWDGYFTEMHPELSGKLESANVLPVASYPQEAVQALTLAQRLQDGHFLECRDHLTGATVYSSDGSMTGHVYGMSVAPTEEMAERITASNKETAADFQTVLAANSLSEVSSGLRMSLYYARRLINLVEGTWCSDSMAFSHLNGTAAIPEILNDMRHALASPEASRLALVAVDFHY